MGKENKPNSTERFNFTDNERLFDSVSDTRFNEILRHEQTIIHEISLSTNSFGEFLFVTASLGNSENHRAITFWGLGFHEAREQWLSEYWSWFDSQRTFEERMDKEKALTDINKRREDVLSWDTRERPSKRAQLYALLAELTDEDGALTELDDLGELLDGEE